MSTIVPTFSDTTMQAAANGSKYARPRQVEKPAPNRRQLPYDMVVIAASAGGIQALISLLGKLTPDFQASIAIVQHRGATHKSMLTGILQRHCVLPVRDATEDLQIAPGVVYVAPPDRHLVIRENHTFGLFDGTRICHVLSSANPLFTSAAEVFGPKTIAIVLTGGDSDGTMGTAVVKQFGGLVIVQDEGTSQQFSMPQSVIQAGSADFILPIDMIGPILADLARPRLHRQAAPDTPRMMAKG